MFDVRTPEVSRDLIEGNYARYRIEPLQPGWGTTLGASLRRILISSLLGAAVTGIRLTPMPEDPEQVPGIEEGLIDLILNIKQLRFRLHGDLKKAPAKLRAFLRVDGRSRGEVIAAALELPENVEVIDPDVVIATATGHGTPLEIELLIESGRGYEPADERTDLPEDFIAVDAMYTPVPRVNYLVEHTRVGGMTDYDRLLLEIWTDGTMQPDDALSQAAQILTQYATVVARYGRDTGELALEEAPAPAEDEANRPIESLGLSMRTTNALRRANITTIREVLSMSDSDLLHLRNFGEKSLVELQNALAAHGFLKPDEGTEAGQEEGARE